MSGILSVVSTVGYADNGSGNLFEQNDDATFTTIDLVPQLR